jgi:hypothetical protein
VFRLPFRKLENKKTMADLKIGHYGGVGYGFWLGGFNYTLKARACLRRAGFAPLRLAQGRPHSKMG